MDWKYSGATWNKPLITTPKADPRILSEEGNAVYPVGLEEHCLLRILSTKWDIELKKTLFPDELNKSRNQWKLSRISQIERCRLPLRQYQISRFFVEPEEIGSVFLRCPTAYMLHSSGSGTSASALLSHTD